MPTPTNSVINRAEEQADYFANLVVENESLRMEVESLTAKLNSSGVLQLHELREENERLTLELHEARVQLEEKKIQLEQFENSTGRFNDINESLKQLLQQVQDQRKEEQKELTEVKYTLNERESRIAALMEDIQHLKAANESTEEKDSLRETIESLRSELQTKEQQWADAQAEILKLQDEIKERDQQLLQLKEEAAERSRVKNREVGSKEESHAEEKKALLQEVEQLREEGVQAQKQLMEKEEKNKLLQSQLSVLQEQLQQQQRERKESVRKETMAAVGSAASSPDPLSDTDKMKELVEAKVQKICADKDKRMEKLVNDNATLLSRMALMQQESDELLKKYGLGKDKKAQSPPAPPIGAAAGPVRPTVTPPPPVNSTGTPPEVAAQLGDLASKREAAKSTMQKRVADFLMKTSAGAQSGGPGGARMIDLKELEMLLQDMLDYQEDIEQNSRTQLLIREMRFEDESKALLRRVMNAEGERDALMRNISKEALKAVQANKPLASSPTAPPQAAPRPPPSVHRECPLLNCLLVM